MPGRLDALTKLSSLIELTKPTWMISRGDYQIMKCDENNDEYYQIMKCDTYIIFHTDKSCNISRLHTNRA
jgi:hypothetical protein